MAKKPMDMAEAVSKYLSAGTGNPLARGERKRYDILYALYMSKLVELSANRFKWSGLPPEVDVRFMELTILRSGVSMFYYEREYDKFMARETSPSGMLNNQDEPIAFTMNNRVASSGMATFLKKGEGVPVWGNYLRTPDILAIDIFASRLADIDLTIEINSRQARRSRILIANKNQRLSLQTISNEIDEGVSTIGVNPSFDPESIQAIDMGVNPDNIEKLHIARGRVWNQCMSILGINNANQDKKERLVADEVSANDEQVDAMRAVYLNARKRAAAEMNSLYDGSEEKALITGYRGEPLNVDVSYVTVPDKAPAPALPGFGFEGESEEGDE